MTPIPIRLDHARPTQLVQSRVSAFDGLTVVPLEEFPAVGVDVDIVDQQEVDGCEAKAAVRLLDRPHHAVVAQIVGRDEVEAAAAKAPV